MHEDENVQVVQNLLAAWQRGDVAAAAENLADDVTWEIPGPLSVTFTGHRFGRDDVVTWMRALECVAELQTQNVSKLVAQDNAVAVLGSSVRRAVETGKKLELEWVMVFHLRDGKVTAFRQYTDTAAIARAFDTGQAKPATPDRKP